MSETFCIIVFIIGAVLFLASLVIAGAGFGIAAYITLLIGVILIAVGFNFGEY